MKILIATLLVLLASLGGSYAQSTTTNLLKNASFEEGRLPFFSLWGTSEYWEDFTISDAQAKTGKQSARIDLNTNGNLVSGTRVWGVIRDLSSVSKVPKKISGHYYTTDWLQGTRNQYLQVVVIFFPGPKGFSPFRDRETPLQIAFVLGGISQPPFLISNRKFRFSSPDGKLIQNEWVPFEFDLHKALKELWGEVPQEFSKIRVLFEARFDNWQPAKGDGPITGSVFYDDLYLGD